MNDFKTLPTIVCPQCKVKQTGIIKSLGNSGLHYIQCCMKKCEHVIQGDELEEVTRQVVKGPADLNKY